MRETTMLEDTPGISENMRTRLKRASEAIAEYAAQQQIIFILLERLGGSVTISDKSIVTRRYGTILVIPDPELGNVTISIRKDEIPTV